MSKKIKYRVKYYESERGWGSDSWNTDYPTQLEAENATNETNAKNVSTHAPDYYITATYIGEVLV